MAKFASDSVLDALLDKVSTGTVLSVCSTQPTDRTEAVTTYMLANIVIDSADFTKSNGDISGRKVVIGQQDLMNVDNSGTASHIAICDGTDLLYVTTCTPQVMVSGNKVTTPSWKIEVSDPA